MSGQSGPFELRNKAADIPTIRRKEIFQRETISAANSKPTQVAPVDPAPQVSHHLRLLYRIRKVQFLLILLIGLVAMGMQIVECTLKYYLFETATGDKYLHTSLTSFPVLTLCPSYPYKNLDKHGIKNLNDIQSNAVWVSNNSNLSPKEFYEDVVVRLEDIVSSLTVFTEGVVDGKNNYILRPTSKICNESLFVKKPYYFNGDCFSLVMPKCLREAGVLEIDIDLFNDTDIYIHHDGEFLSPNSKSRIDVVQGHFVKIAINHEVVQLLGENETCVVNNNNNNVKDFDGCMYDALNNISLAELNCTVPWILDQSRICIDPDKRVKAFDIYQKNRRNQNDVCKERCLFTNMYFGPPVTGLQNKEKKNLAWAVFYFKRTVKVTTEYFLYPFLTLLAEIGGYLVLLLGFSLFNLKDVNNFFLDIFIRRFEAKIEPRDIGTGKRIQEVQPSVEL